MSTTEQTVGSFISQNILRGSADDMLDPERPLLEEGVLDSLALQQLVMFIEKEYSVKFVDEYLVPDNFESIRAIANFVDTISA